MTRRVNHERHLQDRVAKPNSSIFTRTAEALARPAQELLMVKASRRHAATPKPNHPRRSPARFKEREVARALRAARRAGGVVDRVEVDPVSGKIAVILVKQAAGTADRDTWDEVLTDAAHKERPT
jgi:hypothetical protein